MSNSAFAVTMIPLALLLGMFLGFLVQLDVLLRAVREKGNHKKGEGNNEPTRVIESERAPSLAPAQSQPAAETHLLADRLFAVRSAMAVTDEQAKTAG